LFEVLLPEHTINQDKQDFISRYGLRDKPSLVRLRLLEEQLEWNHGIRVDDLSIPVNQLAHLLADHIKPRHVVIVENLINFLTLPKIPNGVGIFGGGFAVHLLRDIQWLNQCNVIYWGDIDAHGFEILSDLRGLFPNIHSIMMDRETIDRFNQYIVQGMKSRSERFNYLTELELQLVQDVIENDWRLEQEHIPQDYAVSCLNQQILYLSQY